MGGHAKSGLAPQQPAEVRLRRSSNFDESTMILVDVDLDALNTSRPHRGPSLAKERTTLVMLDPAHRRARAFATYNPRLSSPSSPSSPSPWTSRPSSSRPTIDPTPLYFGHFTARHPARPELDPTRWFAFVTGFLVTVLAWAFFVKAPPVESLRRSHGATAATTAAAAAATAPMTRSPSSAVAVAIR